MYAVVRNTHIKSKIFLAIHCAFFLCLPVTIPVGSRVRMYKSECRKKKRHPQYGQIPIYIHIVESNSRGIESFYFIKFANKSEMLQWTWFYSFIIEFIVLHIVYVFFKMCMVAEQSVLQYIEQMTQNTCRSKRLLNFFSFIRAHLHIYTAMFAQRCQQYYP